MPAWAAFLGSSWTWCIGMFLPVILVRDYGVWGWVTFAVPNVLGAAAMGWVLRDGQSERMVPAHRPALVAFSVVTAAFQVFFALWMLPQLGLPKLQWATLAAGAVLVWVGGRWQQWPHLVLAGAALLASVVAWVAAGRSGELLSPVRLWTTDAGRFPPDLALLAPVMAFGFAFCPYLDLTFHRARQQTRGAHARAAFSLGFGVLFLAMIVFTLYYAVPVSRHLTDPSLIGQALLTAVGLHMLGQLAFTIGAHWRDAARTIRFGDAVVPLASVALGVVAWLASTAIDYPAADPARTTARVTFGGGELVYLLFMSFYGLAFPAYAWLCITPTWRAPTPPDRRAWATFAVVVLIAAPMYWMGFVERETTWLLPALAVVLLARLATRRPPNGARG